VYHTTKRSIVVQNGNSAEVSEVFLFLTASQKMKEKTGENSNFDLFLATYIPTYPHPF
jgi:hypothetical protein